MSSVTNHSRYLSSHLDAARQNPNQPVLRKRSLGATGILVGEIGLGTAQLGAEDQPDQESVYAIGHSLDMEANLIDVAPTWGRALTRVGRAIASRRQQAVLSLKVGYNDLGVQDFTPKGLRANLEASLKGLGTTYADLALLHNPPVSVLNAANPVWAELAKLKTEGKIRAFGVSLTTADEGKAALTTPAQVLQLPYNVFCQDHAANIDAAAKKRVGIIANRPLDSGWLSGRFGAQHIFFDARRRWSLADKERRAAMQPLFEALVASPTGRPAQAALQFVLANPGVSCALAGASAWQQVIGNVSASSAPLDPGVVAKLKDLWDKQLKAAPLGI